jgi:hypothetical protein
MRDYQRIATLIYHDETQEPGAFRLGNWFRTNDEMIAYWVQIQQISTNYVADVKGYRWYGWDRARMVQILNTAFPNTAPFNWQVFVTGTPTDEEGLPDPAYSPIVFVESPRKDGFNSLSEKPERRKRS